MGLRLICIGIVLIALEAASAQEVHEHPTIKRMHHVNNSIRGRFQLPAQSLSPALSRAAQLQAEYMAGTHKFSHYVNGSPGLRASRYGYNGTVVENIARSYYSVEEAFYAWADSPQHWKALIDSNTEVGFGYSIAEDGTTYWVAVYGKPSHAVRTRSPSRLFVEPPLSAIKQTGYFLLIGS